MTDPLSSFKKKKADLPKPQPVSTHFTKSAPSSPALHKPQPRTAQHKAQVQRVQSTKVKPVRYQAKQQRAQSQAPAYRDSDFTFATNVDNLGVNIAVRFQGTLIYQFLLPVTEYELWQRMSNSWTNRYEYVRMKVPIGSFMNDSKLVHYVIETIVNVLDTLFTESRKHAQATQQQQQQQQQHRRV